MDLTPLLDTRRLVAVALAVFLVVAAGAGLGRTLFNTGDSLGIRRVATPEITPDWHVSERFRMNTDGLRAITIRPIAVGAPEGRIRFELRSLTPYAAPVYRSADVPASALARADAYRFAFTPIADSRDAAYQLDIRSSADAPSRGIAFRATRGERLRDGALLINDRERWAELTFRTESTYGTVATVKAITALTLMCGAWIAFVFLLREIIRGA